MAPLAVVTARSNTDHRLDRYYWSEAMSHPQPGLTPRQLWHRSSYTGRWRLNECRRVDWTRCSWRRFRKQCVFGWSLLMHVERKRARELRWKSQDFTMLTRFVHWSGFSLVFFLKLRAMALKCPVNSCDLRGCFHNMGGGYITVSISICVWPGEENKEFLIHNMEKNLHIYFWEYLTPFFSCFCWQRRPVMYRRIRRPSWYYHHHRPLIPYLLFRLKKKEKTTYALFHNLHRL